MDYLCLAAGKGTRFGRLGSYLQKCMYPVGLKPFLAYSLANLRASRRCDVTRDRLTLVVGHHAEQVRRYFGTRFEGLELHYLVQADPLGTGHALKLAYDALAPCESVVVWLADLYVPVALFERIAAHPAPNVLTLAPGHEAESEALKVSTQGERVVKAWQGEGGRYDIGLWKLEPAVLAEMASVKAANGEYRALPNLQRCLERGAEVGYVQADEWLHLGGVTPTVEGNLRAVVARLWAMEGAR